MGSKPWSPLSKATRCEPPDFIKSPPRRSRRLRRWTTYHRRLSRRDHASLAICDYGNGFPDEQSHTASSGNEGRYKSGPEKYRCHSQGFGRGEGKLPLSPSGLLTRQAFSAKQSSRSPRACMRASLPSSIQIRTGDDCWSAKSGAFTPRP
jgi:hypothetical protein